jgi:hypothetical protein
MPAVVLDRLLTDVMPQDGWALGLAARWPQPAKELALHGRLLELWHTELRASGLESLGTEPLVAALRARAEALRSGPTAHALGTVRLAQLLHRTADELAARKG